MRGITRVFLLLVGVVWLRTMEEDASDFDQEVARREG